MSHRHLFLIFFTCSVASTASAGEPWKRHAIDNAHRGADGVRLADFNGDGLEDVVTGWEESGLVKLYLNPGASKAHAHWPSVIVGQAKSPEDAVAIDVDDDGHLDVVSCHEGKQRQLLVHWNDASDDGPSTKQALLDRSSWSTDAFDALDGMLWMFATPLGKIDSRVSFAVASKGNKASITLLLGPKKPSRDLSQYQVIRLRPAGWIMSLRSIDMDGDGDLDIVFSDRKGSRTGAAWLEQPDDVTRPWTEHRIAGEGKEVMFLAATESRCLIATRNDHYLDCTRISESWQTRQHANPDNVPMGKAIERFPDGSIVLTANSAASKYKQRPGIWLKDSGGHWSPIDETAGVKFDRMELIDLDGDGDLDVMTCEERQNLGVIWYENPSK